MTRAASAQVGVVLGSSFDNCRIVVLGRRKLGPGARKLGNFKFKHGADSKYILCDCGAITQTGSTGGVFNLRNCRRTRTLEETLGRGIC